MKHVPAKSHEIAILQYAGYTTYDEEQFVAGQFTEWTVVDHDTFNLLKKAETQQHHPMWRGKTFRIYERLDSDPTFVGKTIDEYLVLIKAEEEKKKVVAEQAAKKKAVRDANKQAKTLEQKRLLLAQLQKELGTTNDDTVK